MNQLKEFAAAIMFFTRLPLWKFVHTEKEHYRHVVEWWAATGLITGSASAFVLSVMGTITPWPIAVISAITCRLLLTGALHEDGLADFFDGMGGGTTRERRLEIMKDSHIGTYGVLALIIYFLALYNCLMYIGSMYGAIVLICADVWCKQCASFIVDKLPYARTEQEAKNNTVYTKNRKAKKWITTLIAALPTLLFFSCSAWVALVTAMVFCKLLFAYMKRKIGGYTGDCCGATFLMAEICFYTTLTIVASPIHVAPLLRSLFLLIN